MAGNERDIKVIVDNVSKIFSTRNGEIIALDKVNLDIVKNEFMFAVGPSGCGKSTLLNIMAGLLDATSGAVYVDGEKVESTDVERGVVFQQYALFPWLTVKQNVDFGLKLNKELSKNDIDVISNKYIGMIGLEKFSNAYPKELSGGMKQRVAIARAYATNPSLLLLDEPFGALDAQTKAQLQSDLLDMWEKEQKTCFFITHDVEEAILLGQRIIILSSRPGKIKEILEVELPYPRTHQTKLLPIFSELKNYIMASVYEENIHE